MARLIVILALVLCGCVAPVRHEPVTWTGEQCVADRTEWAARLLVSEIVYRLLTQVR